jgi:translation initiation factor IF-1
MLPIILALAGGYLIVDSQKEKLKFEDGGKMEKGGKLKVGDKVIHSFGGKWYRGNTPNFKKGDIVSIETNSLGNVLYEVKLTNGATVYGDKKEVEIDPDIMADGGTMAKGGEIEEGDYVFVKPEKLNGEVIRITGENVVVEFTNRRPQSGDKRRNYKIKDLRKMADGGKMAKGGKTNKKI